MTATDDPYDPFQNGWHTDGTGQIMNDSQGRRIQFPEGVVDRSNQAMQHAIDLLNIADPEDLLQNKIIYFNNAVIFSHGSMLEKHNLPEGGMTATHAVELLHWFTELIVTLKLQNEK